jgi:hypothetical protein
MVAYFEQAVGVGVVRGMLYYNCYTIIEAYCKSSMAGTLEMPAALHLVQGTGK